MERISQGEPEGPSSEKEISAERSSHGAAAMDASEERGLARPRKDKAAIFDARARTIIIVLYWCMGVKCTNVRRAGVWLRCAEKTKLLACKPPRSRGKCRRADAKRAIMPFYGPARSAAGIVIGRVCFACGQGFFGEWILCAVTYRKRYCGNLNWKSVSAELLSNR